MGGRKDTLKEYWSIKVNTDSHKLHKLEGNQESILIFMNLKNLMRNEIFM